MTDRPRGSAANSAPKISRSTHVILETQRSDAVARVTQVIAATENGVLHFFVRERLHANEALAANIVATFARLHQDDWV